MNFLSQITGSFAQPSAENPTVAMVEAAYRHHGVMRAKLEEIFGG
jgi:shikimate dehydrogenase